jgi:broad specificity phosphatase PhoE
MLTLVRHAATAWSGIRYCGRTDEPLSGLGREQIAPLVAYVCAVTPDRTSVITSPARRCRMTAEPIAAGLAGELLVDDRLREADFGAAEGLTFAEIEGRWPELAAALARGDGHVDWPGGERWCDFTERVRMAWIDLSGRTTDTVTVAHGGPLRAMLELALPTWPAALPQRLAPSDVVRLVRGDQWAVQGFWSVGGGVHPCPD